MDHLIAHQLNARFWIGRGEFAINEYRIRRAYVPERCFICTSLFKHVQAKCIPFSCRKTNEIDFKREDLLQNHFYSKDFTRETNRELPVRSETMIDTGETPVFGRWRLTLHCQSACSSFVCAKPAIFTGPLTLNDCSVKLWCMTLDELRSTNIKQHHVLSSTVYRVRWLSKNPQPATMRGGETCGQALPGNVPSWPRIASECKCSCHQGAVGASEARQNPFVLSPTGL